MSTINQGKDNLLNQLFQELKKKNEEIKRKAAENLKLYVKDRSMELSGEAFTVFMNDLNRRIFEFVNSTDINEKLGGVIAIDELIDVRGEDNALKMTRFSNYLRHVLATNDPAIMKTAAKTLSHLAKVGGALTADFVESELKKALEWLQDEKIESRKQTALLILTELTRSAPTIFYTHIHTFFDVIWNALKHNKVNIREAAVVTLRAGLKLINSREKKLRDQWYFKIYSEAQKYIKQNNSDSIHGALLVFGELLSITDSFIESYFGEVCDLIFSFRDHKDKTVRKAVIYLIPLLAKFFPSDFVNRYLDISIKHTLNSLKKDYIDKTTIFQAIGDLSLAVNQQIMPYIKDIMQKIRDSLVVTKKKNYCPEAMICVAQLSSSLKTQLVEEIKKNNILDSMFNSGLSEILIRSLSQISRNIPDLKLEIQERVLNTLSIILSRKPYFTPKSVIESTVNTNTRLNDSLTIAIDSSTPQVILALQTLRTFDFGTNDLLEFVRDKVLVYLESETGEIRTEATTTCIKILVCSVSEKKEIGSFREKQVENILHKVLMLGIIDPDNRNRYAVFDSLDQTLDPYLSKTSNLATLFVALNDEMFEIRELAITIIGRLSERNPSDVMPTLRKTLIQLLSELEYTQDLRLKEESARSLVHFIRSTKQLNKAYCKSILRDLLPKLTSLAKSKTHSGIFMQVLAAIGELGMIGREHIAPYVDQLVALILETLQEQSDPVHRKIALYTLGQLIESTGWVIDPYVKFPRLMNTLLILLRTGRDEQIKKDVLRIMGMLGALDPYRQKMVVSHISDVNENVAANAGRSGGGVAVNGTGKRTKSRGGAAKVTGKRTEDEISGRVGGKGGKDGAKKNEKAARGNREKTSGTTDPILPGICLSFDKYYASVAIDALMKILADPTLATHHTMVVQALMFICKSLGTRIVPFLGQIMPSFLSAAKKSEPRLREFLFQQLPGIVTIVRHNIREYTDEILTLIREFWGDDVLPYSVQLLEQLSELSAAKFKVHLPSLLPLMFNSMLGENNDERKVTQIVLRALEQFGRNLDDAAHLVVPVLIKLFEQVNSPIGVRIAAIKTLGGLAIRVGLGDYSSRIMHSLTRVLCVNHGELRTAVMETFCSIAIQLQREYIIYVPMVGAVLAANRIHYHPYDTIVIKLLKNEPLPSVSLSQTSDSSLQNTSEKSRTGRFGESITNDNADDSMVLLSSELSLDMEISQLNSDSGDPLAISGGPNSEKKGISLSGKDGEESRKPPKKLYVNQAVLKKAWDATARSTREDWEEWIRKFAVELLYQSPSPVLRSCSGLAQIYHPLSRRLFYAGFLSCWNELYDQYQDELVHSLETAFIADSIPPDILQLLLNLTKFMEHVDKTLPINIGTLSELAIKCHAYPLALRYKELEFQTNPSGTIEALISINNQLQHSEAAVGVLRFAQQNHAIELKESWYEELNRWEDALAAYDAPRVPDIGERALQRTLGKIRCLHALGDWEPLSDLVRGMWDTTDPETRNSIASIAALSAWNTADWATMDLYVSAIPQSSIEGAFLRAVVCVHQDDFLRASALIDATRRSVIDTFGALVSESYGRAYNEVVLLQQLSELEEVIEYKHAQRDSDLLKMQLIREKWRKRLLGCENNISVWQRIMAVHSLVVPPEQNLAAWIKFASICRNGGNLRLSEKVITSFLRHARDLYGKNLTDNSHDFDENLNKKLNDLKLMNNFNENNNNFNENKIEFDENNMEINKLENIPSKIEKIPKPRRKQSIKLLDIHESNLVIVHPHIAMAYFEHLWDEGKQIQAVEKLKNYTLKLPHIFAEYAEPIRTYTYCLHSTSKNNEKIAQNIQQEQTIFSLTNSRSISSPLLHLDTTDRPKDMVSRLHAKFYLKLGEWQSALCEGEINPTDKVVEQILQAFQKSTQCDPQWYRAWHSYALVNFEILSALEGVDPLTDAQIQKYLIPSIKGFFQSILHSKFGQSIRDTLRLLTLLFKHGKTPQSTQAFIEGFSTVSIDTWLQVIPQIIARIHTPSQPVRELINHLLSEISKEHPQALVYPLTVASKSRSARRTSFHQELQKESPQKKKIPLKNVNVNANVNVNTKLKFNANQNENITSKTDVSREILENMKSLRPNLVEQAEMVSQELIRVAILWNEMWHESLEIASKYYYKEGNVEAMIAALQPMHEKLEKGPETAREISFAQAYGAELELAKAWTERYQKTGHLGDLSQAWNLYSYVFTHISKEITQLSTVELQYASPRLQKSKNLELAVPGTYRAGEPVVHIRSFAPALLVIPSKQRPRKAKIYGSTGAAYRFLLKGHEDPRQDERVMQLFGLVNNLLSNTPSTSKMHLRIQRYAVVPLSPNSGLIGWVPHCDTLNKLIREYREANKILLDIERRLMDQMAPDYDKLNLIQKVEVFKHSLDNTTGQDIDRVLWLKSENSEIWLDRRTTYTRSLAVMSMVGYILGLGDRHPSNLMMDRFTGKILHIDFGDCFEVAMLRKQFPEKVPFRLTRMLINAMEVSGIEGNFRSTCELVMSVLRDNKDSLMAILEAFVYDPLVNWHIMRQSKNLSGPQFSQQEKIPDSDALFPSNLRKQEPQNQPQDPKKKKPYLIQNVQNIPKNSNSISDSDPEEILNSQVLGVIKRISNKLTGKDFEPDKTLNVPQQVDRLILQATSHENLCQAYSGWCPFW